MRPFGVDERDGVGRIGDRGREVDHLEHPLERDERSQHVDPGVRQLRERLVDERDVRRERGQRARADRPRHREVPTDPVDDRGAERGDETEGHQQDPAVDRSGDADVAHAARPLREDVAFAVGATEELGEHGAGDVEALGGDVVHLRVLLHADPGELLDTRSEQPGRIDEERQREQREQREPPAERQHDREGHDQAR